MELPLFILAGVFAFFAATQAIQAHNEFSGRLPPSLQNRSDSTVAMNLMVWETSVPDSTRRKYVSYIGCVIGFFACMAAITLLRGHRAFGFLMVAASILTAAPVTIRWMRYRRQR
jgi:hypothetical protein